MAQLNSIDKPRFKGWRLLALPTSGVAEGSAHLEIVPASNSGTQHPKGLGIDVDRDELLEALGAAEPETRANAAAWKTIARHPFFHDIEVDRPLLQAMLRRLDGAVPAREVKNPDDDERVKAWEAIAAHEFFASCYDDECPLIDAILERLDVTVAQLNASAERLIDAVERQRQAEHNLRSAEAKVAERDRLCEQLDESQRVLAGLLRLIAVAPEDV